ncbi:hypothetical protein C0J52_23972 [Blattella germanica]|nr:hypothetical protein C0J52_23972 [Blattella germanica]
MSLLLFICFNIRLKIFPLGLLVFMPCLFTTKALGSSPAASSGIPITAASLMAGLSRFDTSDSTCLLRGAAPHRKSLTLDKS